MCFIDLARDRFRFCRHETEGVSRRIGRFQLTTKSSNCIDCKLFKRIIRFEQSPIQTVTRRREPRLADASIVEAFFSKCFSGLILIDCR
jgi:hypothetical protein